MEETKVPGENINLLQVTDKLREFKKCRNKTGDLHYFVYRSR
jgi:hypothetical protein